MVYARIHKGIPTTEHANTGNNSASVGANHTHMHTDVPVCFTNVYTHCLLCSDAFDSHTCTCAGVNTNNHTHEPDTTSRGCWPRNKYLCAAILTDAFGSTNRVRVRTSAVCLQCVRVSAMCACVCNVCVCLQCVRVSAMCACVCIVCVCLHCV